MAENHGNVDTKSVNLRLEVEKYPMHTEYKLEGLWLSNEDLISDHHYVEYVEISICARGNTFLVFYDKSERTKQLKLPNSLKKRYSDGDIEFIDFVRQLGKDTLSIYKGKLQIPIDKELCQDPHNMTAEDWTLLTMLYPQITTQYWNILKLLKDYVDKHIEEEYLIENVKCILKGEAN